MLILFFLFFPSVEKHIIVGAEEGIYSLNFSEQLHEAEMEQVITLLGRGYGAHFQSQLEMEQVTTLSGGG